MRTPCTGRLHIHAEHVDLSAILFSARHINGAINRAGQLNDTSLKAITVPKDFMRDRNMKQNTF
jgi:hypothetical protein